MDKKKEQWIHKKAENNKQIVNSKSLVSVITLNLNVLDFSIKRQRETKWKTKQNKNKIQQYAASKRLPLALKTKRLKK